MTELVKTVAESQKKIRQSAIEKAKAVIERLANSDNPRITPESLPSKSSRGRKRSRKPINPIDYKKIAAGDIE